MYRTARWDKNRIRRRVLYDHCKQHSKRSKGNEGIVYLSISIYLSLHLVHIIDISFILLYDCYPYRSYSYSPFPNELSPLIQVAPLARVNDGLIDLIIVRSSQKHHMMKIFTGMYDNGNYIYLPFVEFKQVRGFCIKPILEGYVYIFHSFNQSINDQPMNLPCYPF